MKKHSFSAVIKAFSVFMTVSVIFCAGCKSQPQQVRNEVNPLDLLDNQSSFYLAVPAEQDINLVAKMLQNNLKNLSEADAMSVAQRVNVVFAGLTKHKKSTDFQISAGCSVPKAFLPKVFSEKNGWSHESLSMVNPSGKDTVYTVYNNNNLNLAFPDDKTCVLGENVPSKIEKFHYLSQTEELTEQQKETVNQDRITGETYEWLNNNEGEVRFFAQKPQSFLTVLTGANLNFKLIYVKGAMVTDPKKSDKYIMSLDFEFRDSRTVPAAKGTLALAFGLTNSEINQPTPTHVSISNIEIGKQQLYKILVL